MRGVPDRLFRREFRRAEPVGHQRSAGGISHSMDIAVQDPEGADDVDERHRGLAVRIEDVDESVHLRGETDREVDDGRQDQSHRHHQPLVVTVRQDAVDKTGKAVNDAVQGQEETELGLGDPEGFVHGRNGGAEILPEKIVEGIAYDQGDQGPPLPVAVLLLCCFVHR